MSRTSWRALLLGALTGTVPVVALVAASDTGRLARALALHDLLTAPLAPAPSLDVEDLPADAVVVDVRPPEERRVATLPGAVPLHAWSPQAAGDRPVVFTCTVGYRSHEVAARFRAQGVSAWNLRGGLLAWTHAGGPLVDEAGRPTRTLHTYGRFWALQAEGYRAVW